MPRKFSPKLRAKFLDELASTGNVTASAKAVGVGRRTVYDCAGRDEGFKKRFDDALEQGTDSLRG